MDWISDISRILLVAFGIGLVIFVHELGHFLAARRCGVRVETFSLGFGPKLFGWKRGDTTYQLAAVPLGGYVQMKGEGGPTEGEPAAAQTGANATESDDLRSKSVGARFLIFSGGVLMNLVFAMVVFPIVFAIGVPFPEPLLGPAEPGSAAWKAGLPAGTRVLAVDDEPMRGFADIPTAVALRAPEAATLTVLLPGESAPREVQLRPEWNEQMKLYTAGLTPMPDPQARIVVSKAGAAEAAGLVSGERIVAVDGAPATLSVFEALSDRLARGEELRLQVAGVDGTQRSVVVPPTSTTIADKPIAGVSPAWNQVLGLRDVDGLQGLDLRVGDRLRQVNGQWILQHYDLDRALSQASGTVEVVIEREDSVLRLSSTLDSTSAARFVKCIALGQASGSNRVWARAGGAAAQAGVLNGDRIVKIGEARVADFEALRQATQNAGNEARTWTLARTDAQGVERELQVPVAIAPWTTWDAGFALEEARHTVRATGPLDAVAIGLQSSWKFLTETARVLKGLVLGNVGSSNVGGIITIGVVSHSFAEYGLAKFFFFLCILSLNLAFLNVLPIPVLDGGHLFFLLVEKVKGSPVSDRVMGWSQTVGVALVVSLMVWVTFNDVVRWFFT